MQMLSTPKRPSYLPSKSQPAINNAQPPLPPKPHPIDLLRPPPHLHAPPLLLANPDQQSPNNTRVLPDPVALERPQQLDGFDFRVGVRGRDPRDEDGEDDGAVVEAAFGEDGGGEGEDLRGARGGVGCEEGLVGAGEEALVGEHRGAGVE